MCIFLLGIVKFARNLYKVFRTNCDEINTQNLMQSFWWYILFLYILYCFFPPISLDFLCFFFFILSVQSFIYLFYRTFRNIIVSINHIRPVTYTLQIYIHILYVYRMFVVAATIYLFIYKIS